MKQLLRIWEKTFLPSETTTTMMMMIEEKSGFLRSLRSVLDEAGIWFFVFFFVKNIFRAKLYRVCWG